MDSDNPVGQPSADELAACRRVARLLPPRDRLLRFAARYSRPPAGVDPNADGGTTACQLADAIRAVPGLLDRLLGD
jgi:hypothetical protein